MSFRRTLEFFVYATVLWAFATLAFFAQLHLLAVALFAFAFVLRLFRDTLGIRLSPLFWLMASGVVLVGSFYGWFVLYERLYTVVYLFLYLQLNKLWTWEKNRDLLQLFGLTFFHMLAAAVSTQSVLFAPALLVYLFLILGGLITLTLKKDAEKALLTGRRKGRGEAEEEDPFVPVTLHADSRTRLGEVFARPYLTRSFLGSVSGVLVLILALGTAVFYAIPRLQAHSRFTPHFSTSQMARSQSGFSDFVELSASQEVQLDPTVAMRAYPLTGYDTEGGMPAMGIMRLRGSTLDHYDGRRWTRGETLGRRGSNTRREHGKIAFPDEREPFAFETKLETAIELEPGVSSFLFAPEGVQSYELVRRNESFTVNDETRTVRFADQSSAMRQVQYVTQSRGALRPPSLVELMAAYASATGADEGEAELLAAAKERSRFGSPGTRVLNSLFRLWNPTVSGLYPERLSRELEEMYLSLPEHSDMEVVSRLAGEWTEGHDHPIEIAKELELSLKRNYGYSLRIPFSRRPDHLAYFLTEARAAHCEYFATAMTLMLRTQGVPSRLVTGYASDEWVPDKQGHYIVRQEHAHVWVEAYIPAMGWVSFDPTPNSGIGGGRIPDTWARRFNRWMDDVRLAWYGAVIDFNADSQEQVYQAVFSPMQGLPSVTELLTRSPAEEERRTPVLPVVLSFAGAMALGLLLIRELMARRRLPAQGGGEQGWAGRNASGVRIEDYLRLLREVEKQVSRTPSETPLEYARKISVRDEPLAEEFAEITEMYYGARFDGVAWRPQDSQRANALLRRLREKQEGPRRIAVSSKA